MPGEDGLNCLRWLRSHSTTPVIMLTAAADTTDRVVGLEMGADDYLGKPVDLRELEARIKAVLRRHSFQTEETQTVRGTVAFGSCKLDLEGCRLFDKGRRQNFNHSYGIFSSETLCPQSRPGPDPRSNPGGGA